MRETSHSLSNYQNSQQPKHFRGGEKKVMKKSLSLLVAIAMVFSMFASVAAAAASEAGKKLEGYGVIKGNQNGDLLEDENWLRQDVAVLISRLAGKEEEAKATAKTHTFADVRGTFYNGYISWAKENGFMQGNSATNFGFDSEITYKEFATVILRALGVDTTDYSKIGELAVKAGIIGSDLNIDDKAKRGVTYDIIVTSLDVEVAGTGKVLGEVLGLPGFEKPAPAIDAKATSVKEVTVTFNKAIDTANAKFELTRSQTAVKVDKVTFSDDKKVAKLELNSKLVAGDYTLVAKGATDVELSATFSAENEKVAEIKFLGDKLALGTNTDGNVNSDQVEISFQVTNQYGDDVTRTYGSSVNFQASKGSIFSQTNGKLVIENTAQGTTYQINEQVYVSASYTSGTNNVFVNNTFSVGAQSRVDSVTVKELYHPEDKTISAGSNFSEYTLIFEAKDQYGNLITDLAKLKKDLSVFVTNPSIFDIAKDNNNANFLADQGKNKDKLGLKLKSPNTGGFAQEGTNTITFNSIFTGKQTKFDVEVTKGTAVQSISLVAPYNLAVGDKKVKVAFTAIDGNGNEVTKYDDLVDRITLNSSVPGNNFKFVKDTLTGKATLELDITNASQGTYGLYAYVKNTNSQAQVQFTIAAAPKPTDIKKVDIDRSKIIKGNPAQAVFEVKPDKVKIEDNLSRDWKLTSAYTLKLVQVSSNNNFVISGNDDNDVVTDNTIITATASGTARFRVTLTGDNTNLSYEFTISAVELKDLKNFSVDDISKFFGGADSKHAREIKVFGVNQDGEKVQLDKSQYDVFVPTARNLSYVDGKIKVTEDSTGYPFDKSSVTEETFSFTVQIQDGKGGIEQVTKSAKVSNELPKITKVEYKSDNKFKGENGYVTVQTGATFATIQDLFNNALKFVDQYGDDSKYVANVTITGDSDVLAKLSAKSGKSDVITVARAFASGDKFIVNYTIQGETSGVFTVEVE
ncbi:S-layer homology domain-containing protein [Paenibacillus sp. GCM10012307]|uniref:S-layer homology domain-containing protein n=1 Tax=Paenibacillus roseus TaxID=2798579 RepID=A0A934J7N1_9BACL|nr:S-layer homology domain-containing protein [Paenibacillus roseus]MBJ6361912.1 S-layer homology domain-containing protein [Paenibacillus roseus]